MNRQRELWLIAALGLGVFALITVAVTTSGSLGIDAAAFDLADDVRAPWLDRVAHIVTTFGLLGIVGPAVLVAAVLLARRDRLARGVALATGAGVTWLTVWVIKGVLGRERPPHPLVHTGGASYPSGHAANSIGWAAIGVGLGVLIAARGARTAAVIAGCLLAGLVGLSRVYLRAHYLSDVFAGEALAVAIYAGLAAGTLAWLEHRRAREHVGAQPQTSAERFSG